MRSLAGDEIMNEYQDVGFGAHIYALHLLNICWSGLGGGWFGLVMIMIMGIQERTVYGP